MSLQGFLARLARRRPRNAGATPLPRNWWQRNRRALIGVAAVVVALVVGLLGPWVPWSPFRPCGPDLIDVGPPSNCVGLDVDSAALSDNDQLADLEGRINALNSQVTGDDFATIVLLDNMTPDPTTDSIGLKTLRHRVEGAITAEWRANNSTVGGGTQPKIKLLLANYGAGAAFQAQAVDTIEQTAGSEHIVAVAGMGQSLDTTRMAVRNLSDHGIVTVGSVVSADDMNQYPTGQLIKNFFRVTPTNADAARAAVSYIANQHYQRIMLVQDTNESDSYAQTLAFDVRAAFHSRYPTLVPFIEPYQSPGELHGMPRPEYMEDRFAAMHADLCSYKPDLIYFAGRGPDLGAFLTALSQGGACGLGSMDVLSNDPTDLLGTRLPSFGDMQVRLLYTGVATRDEWQSLPLSSIEYQNYAAFLAAFAGKNGFNPEDLEDGHAMLSHDAVLTAVTAVRNDPVAVTDPSTVAASFLRFTCQHAIPGASGQTAFAPNGDPIDKAMPIMLLQPNGDATQEGLAWASGQPFDAAGCH